MDFPKGCSKFGITRLDTEKPVKPALGFAHAPLPLHHESPRQSLLQHQEMAEIAVGWLCVSTFIKM